MPLSNTFYIKQNDRQPVLIATLLGAGNVAANLTTATGVKFNMRLAGSSVAKINAAAVITTAASGLVTYSWGATDTNTAGRYQAEWEVTWTGGLTQTFPNGNHDYVVITPQVA